MLSSGNTIEPLGFPRKPAAPYRGGYGGEGVRRRLGNGLRRLRVSAGQLGDRGGSGPDCPGGVGQRLDALRRAVLGDIDRCREELSKLDVADQHAAWVAVSGMELRLDEQLPPYAEPVYVERGVDVNGLMWALVGVGAVFVAFWFGFILAALMASRRVGQLQAQVRELSARIYDRGLDQLLTRWSDTKTG